MPAVPFQDERRCGKEPPNGTGAELANREGSLRDSLEDVVGLMTALALIFVGRHWVHTSKNQTEAWRPREMAKCIRITKFFNTLCLGLSNKRPKGARLFFVTILLLGACATQQDLQVQRLQARSSFEIGMGHLRDGQLGLAQAALEQAIRLDPDQPLYLNALGLVYLELRRWAEAKALFEQALKIDPNYADAYHHLGVALAESGQWAAAAEAYQKALTIPTYPNRASSYHNLGWAYFNLGRDKDAEDALTRALQLDPQLASVHYTLGLVYEKLRRFPSALESFKRAEALDSNGPIARAAREHIERLISGR